MENNKPLYKNISVWVVGLAVTVLLWMITYDANLDRSVQIPMTPIEAVYMHERGNYSVAVVEDGTLKIKRVPRHMHIEVKFLFGEEKSYMCDINETGEEGVCIITITSISDINGAGWNHGKHGSGNTVRIN